jgi:Transposase
VEIVSRDRSSEYAAAIRKGAPQALQVADLWHIGKNVADSVSTLLARCRTEIRRGLHVQAASEQEEAEPVPEEERHPARSRSEEQARLGRRAQKLDRYTQIIELHDQGLTAIDIASRIGISGRTVHRWLAHGSFRRPPDADEDDPASSILMSVMCCSGGTKETEMDYNCIENWLLVATRVHLKPCTITWQPYGHLDQAHHNRFH